MTHSPNTAIDMDGLVEHLSKHHPAYQPTKLWFIATEDCHLCDSAYDNLKLAAYSIDPALLTDCVVDVLDLPDEFAQTLAARIPVLIARTPTKTYSLYYPFGIMDIVALLQKFHQQHHITAK